MKLTVFRGLFFVLAGTGALSLLAACQRAAQSGPVAAQVGTFTITVGDLKSRLQDAPSDYQQYVATPEGRRKFLDLLIREKVLLSEAKSLGIPRDPAYLQAMKKFKVEWTRRLHDYEEALQVKSAVKRLYSKELAASDDDVEKFYNAHRAEFDHPLEIQTSHILLSTEAGAQAALARLREGESFDKVARAMSKDPGTAARGGRMAPFRRGMLQVPEFEDAAFALKVGETSGIVKSQFGFHIIRKSGEKQLPPRTLADAKEEIRARLERERFNQWVAAKQAVLGVKINENVMQSLTAEEPPQS